jgi:MFS superfamily sulfate permease-like transporter
MMQQKTHPLIHEKGTYAIVSLMVYSSLLKYAGVLYPSPNELAMMGANATASSSIGHSAASSMSAGVGSAKNYISNDPIEAKIQISMVLAFMTGIIQVIFAVLHFGVVTKYLSDSIVNGFTTGAAFHVVVSQISTLLGIKLGDTHIPFVLVGV